MTNLLTEDELKDKLYDMAFEVRQDQESGEYFFLLNEKQLIDIIQSQKIAHADMVIGRRYPIEIGSKEYQEAREELRIEQRGRNHV